MSLEWAEGVLGDGTSRLNHGPRDARDAIMNGHARTEQSEGIIVADHGRATAFPEKPCS